MKGRQVVEEKHGSSDYVSRGLIRSQAPGILLTGGQAKISSRKKGTGKQLAVATLSTTLRSPRSLPHTSLGQHGCGREFNGS